jgi:hypothetical protein
MNVRQIELRLLGKSEDYWKKAEQSNLFHVRTPGL